jgi:hypothetical protein
VSRIKAPRVERGSGTVISRGKVQNLRGGAGFLDTKSAFVM